MVVAFGVMTGVMFVSSVRAIGGTRQMWCNRGILLSLFGTICSAVGGF